MHCVLPVTSPQLISNASAKFAAWQCCITGKISTFLHREKDTLHAVCPHYPRPLHKT